jgi:hypothetical protein
MQHIPRINGSIPTYDDASADHQRLLDRWEEKCHLPLLWLFSLLHWVDGLHHQLLHVENVMVWYSVSDIYKVMTALILVMVLVLIMWHRLRMQSFCRTILLKFLSRLLYTYTHCFSFTRNDVTSKCHVDFLWYVDVSSNSFLPDDTVS